MWSILSSLLFAILSLVIAFGSLLHLGWTDRISLQRGLFLGSLGFVHYISITEFSNKILLNTKFGHKVLKQYKISISDVLDLTSRLVATHQAILCFAFGVMICGYSCRKNFLTASTILSDSYTWFSTSYFLYDVYGMYRTWNCKLFDKYKLKIIDWDAAELNLYSKVPSLANKELRLFEDIVIGDKRFPSFLSYLPKESLMIFHHLFIGIWGFLVVVHLRRGLGDCVFSFYYLMEFSTPFVNLRAIFSMMGMKDTKVYLYNALIMFFSFFIVRVLLVPFIMLHYSNIINQSVYRAFVLLPLHCRLSILAIYLPQLYWFYIMAKGAYGLMNKQAKKSSQNNINLDKDEMVNHINENFENNSVDGLRKRAAPAVTETQDLTVEN